MAGPNAKLRWDDGQPFSTQFGDHYYSRHDGLAETRHVFLDGNDLPQRWSGAEAFVVGELGFGTGLNFLATWLLWKQNRKPNQKLLFISVEAFPMSAGEALRALSRWPQLKTEAQALADAWVLDGAICAVDVQTELRVMPDYAEGALDSFPQVDAWFLDGFSPDRNKEMWSPQLMKKVAANTKPGGTFATYTAAGWVRRNLSAAGFSVEKRPGFGAKRDMSVGSLS